MKKEESTKDDIPKREKKEKVKKKVNKLPIIIGIIITIIVVVILVGIFIFGWFKSSDNKEYVLVETTVAEETTVIEPNLNEDYWKSSSYSSVVYDFLCGLEQCNGQEMLKNMPLELIEADIEKGTYTYIDQAYAEVENKWVDVYEGMKSQYGNNEDGSDWELIDYGKKAYEVDEAVLNEVNETLAAEGIEFKFEEIIDVSFTVKLEKNKEYHDITEVTLRTGRVGNYWYLVEIM